MKIAIPVWDNRISPVFDTASRLLIVEVEDQKEVSRFETTLDDQELSRRCLRIQGLGIDMLICGAISRPYSRRLIASGINIISEISGHAEEVLEAYLQGTLSHPRFLMPGCKRNISDQEKKYLACKKPQRKEEKKEVKVKWQRETRVAG